MSRDRGRSGSLFGGNKAPDNTPKQVDAAIFGFSDTSQYATVTEDGNIQIGAFQLTSMGLLADGQIDIGDWDRVGLLLRRLNDGIQWLLGDWVAFGEREWKKTYEQISQETDYSYQTLRDYAFVSKSVPMSIRIDKLAHAHHRLVAGLKTDDEKVYWLNRAAEGDWSVARMRQEIRGDDGGGDLDDPVRQSALAVFHRMQVEMRKVKKHGNDSVRQWIALQRQALDEIERGLE